LHTQPFTVTSLNDVIAADGTAVQRAQPLGVSPSWWEWVSGSSVYTRSCTHITRNYFRTNLVISITCTFTSTRNIVILNKNTADI